MAYTSTAAHPGLVDRFYAAAADLRDRMQRRKLYRTTINELTALSGRELADLGIHRSMIKGIAYRAAYED